MTSIDPSSIKVWIKDQDIYTKVKLKDWGPQDDNKSVLWGRADFLLSGDVQLGGQARFGLQPMDDLVDWQVGFIQILRDSGLVIRYTGRTPREGSIVCTVDKFPPLLDCYENKDKGISVTIPWYKNTPEALFKGGPGSDQLVNIAIVDFPAYGVPVTLQNKTRTVYNFLYDFTAESEFWTILTATSPAKVRQYLGYCHWRVRCKASFIWQFGKPQVSTEWGSFTRLDRDKGEFSPGAPPNADLKPLLANPVGPVANDVTFEQFKAAIKGGGEVWSHVESNRGLSPIVPNFWV